MSPHFLVAIGGFAVVVWQRSIALATSEAVTVANFCTVLQVGAAVVSEEAGSQSSSTPLPTASNAPGFTSALVSLQSPLQEVQPSASLSTALSTVPSQSSSTWLLQTSDFGST
jgi:hypothetical protein